MKRFLNIFILLLSTLLGLALGEVYLHLTDFSYPLLYMRDHVTGSKLRPGAEGWWREEGEAFIKINRDGWRDREHSPEKFASTKRIAILGDSYAEALQVPQEKTFWSLLEGELNACHAFGGMTAEVMNFGVSGYGTAQELLVFQDRVWRYMPDIVMLAFTTGNDVRDNSKLLSNSLPRPYFVHDNGSLILDDSFRQSFGYRVRQYQVWKFVHNASANFKIVQLLNLLFNRVNQFQQRTFQQHDGQQGLEPGLDDDVYREPAGPEWEKAWKVTEHLIVNLRNESVAREARFLLVTLSNGIQVNPSPVTRESFARKLQVSDLFYPERRLKNFGLREQFDVVTLAPRLLNYAEAHQAFLHGFQNTVVGRGHWNEEGHRIAGQLIAEYFCGARNAM